MRFISLPVAAIIVAVLASSPSWAKVSAKINLSSQTMTVRVNGAKRYVWPISSGKDGFLTPRGSFRPHSVEEMHYSKKYENAPMPYSVFFNGGIAVHGTGATWKLGRPASHGCVRLSINNARRFHDLVKQHGKKATRIRVVGRTPYSPSAAPKQNRRHKRRGPHFDEDYYNPPRRGRRYIDYDYDYY